MKKIAVEKDWLKKTIEGGEFFRKKGGIDLAVRELSLDSVFASVYTADVWAGSWPFFWEV